MKKYILAILFALVAAGGCHAQFYSSRNSKAIGLYEKGIAAMQRSEDAAAIKLFAQALKADPDFGEVHLTLAEYYLKLYDYANASTHYQKFLDSPCRNKLWRDDARHGLQTIAFRQEQMAHPVPFEPQNLGPAINTPDYEYLPAMTVDGNTLIYTRRVPRRNTSAAGLQEEEDFYISQRTDKGWSKATRMAEPVNSNDNEGAQCLSQDGRIMFFTACGRRDGRGRCDLYMCTNKSGTWSKPRNIGTPVNTGSWESQPSFSIDGKTLYFVSDRPGGYGGKDIWCSVFENGKFGEPKNLGPTINTAGDEMSPFIYYDDRVLFFASNGHVGMGGLDIFYSTLTDTGWSTPTNLGYPINTEGDESGLIVSSDGTTAIFSSERMGGFGKQDLYTFALPQRHRQQAVCHIKGHVTDKKSGAPLKSSIQVIDLATAREVAVVSSDAGDGSYMVSLPPEHSYAFHVTAAGYLFYSESFDLAGNTTGTPVEYQRPIALSPIEVGQSITLNNIFFETGKYELINSQVELDKVVSLLTQNPTLQVELAGHTDNVGRPADNQVLSQNRAKAVYDYLTVHGIGADRLTYKGYGDTQPVADNATPEGRAQNRRTTFTILNK